MHNPLHPFESPVHAAEIRYIAVCDLAAVPLAAIHIAVRFPGLGTVLEDANFVLAGEIFQHRPPQPAGCSKHYHFHNRFSSRQVFSELSQYPPRLPI